VQHDILFNAAACIVPRSAAVELVADSDKKKLMRILYVNAGNLYGGVEVLLTALARHRGVCPAMEPHFATCFQGRSSEELAASGVPVHVLGEVRVRRPLSVLAARRRLESLIRRERYDAVVCHSAWAQAIFGPAVRAAGVPLLFWLHDPPEKRTLHGLEHWARRSPPDLTLCNSHYTADRVSRLYPASASYLVYCPVAPPEMPRSASDREATRAEFAAPVGGTVFLQIGRWERHKGHLLHLEALRRLAGRRDWCCWQVGAPQRPQEAKYLAEVKALAVRVGIADRIHFLGWQDDLGRILAAADVYCQPNIGTEPFGISLIEALYAGLPVVSTALGGPSEIVTEACGILVSPADPAALADALAALVDDPERRARLSAGGPLRARELCDPTNALGRLAEVLGQFSVA